MSSRFVAIIAAVAANGVIGRDGGLPWQLPEDLPRLKRLTMGHVLVMGRRTYESIGRPLPGRTTVVVTRTPGWAADSVLTASSVEEAVQTAGTIDGDCFLFGGARVYRDGLRFADRMYLTLVEQSPSGDTHFPAVDWADWIEVDREQRDGFAFAEYRRINSQ